MKRIFALFLALLTVTALLAGCNGNKPNTNETTPVDSDTGETVAPEDPDDPDSPTSRSWNDLPKDQYDVDFNILGRGNTGTWDTVDLAVAEEMIAGDELSSAVYYRNSAVERRHNVSISYNAYGGDYATVLGNMAMAGINDYALYDITLPSWGAGVVKGYFKNLYDLTELRFDESWWDHRFVQDLSLYGQLYGILSEATYLDKEATCCVTFNKEMFSAHDLTEDPYAMVNEGTWTYDAVLTLAKKVNYDADDDGVMTLGGADIYGMAGENDNIAFLMQGCGMPIVSYENGEVVLNLKAKREAAGDVFRSLYDMVADSTLTYRAEAHFTEGAWGRGRDFFRQQQCLFYLGAIINLNHYFKEYEHDYGVLPMPKYSVEQEEYYNAVNHYNCPVFSIPDNAENPEMSAIVMQAMACRGEGSLTSVFYNRILKGHAVRDPESCEMLDLIFATRSYDLGCIYSFGGFMDGYGGHLVDLLVDGKKDQLTSTIDSFARLAESQIEDLVAFYDKNIQ